MTTADSPNKNEVTESSPMVTVKPVSFGRLKKIFHQWTRLETPETNGKSATELANMRTNLAAKRTLMAADRTLMAWVRTSMSLLSFGFTIYKILDGFQSTGGALADSTPRNIGLFLSAMGTFAMIMGTLEYWSAIKELRKIQNIRLARPSFIMALVMSVLGVITFFSITTHLF
jgi:putative membrane protein